MPRRKVPDAIALAVGQRVRQLRLERGMTAEALAFGGKINSKGFLSDIESGLARPSLATLKEIADLLGVALLDLVTFPGEDDRQALIDRTRHVPRGVVRKLLNELGTIPTAVPLASNPTKRRPPVVVVRGGRKTAAQRRSKR